jgi:hypothetical protein
VDPLKRMLQLGCELICKINHHLRVCRLQLMLAAGVAVTEMDSEVDVSGNVLARAYDRGDKLISRKRLQLFRIFKDEAEFDGRIPLNGQISVGYGGGNFVDLAANALLIRKPSRLDGGGFTELVDRSDWRW